VSLPRDHIHVWRVDLGAAVGEDAWLSADERARAVQLRGARERERWRNGRFALRRVLADYLGVAPGDLRFGYGRHGKPSLHGCDLRFNLSHSEDVALIAVARGRELGVDIERVRAHEPGVAQLCFAQEEVMRCERARARARAFYTTWTRKEAYIKALGDGFAAPLVDFEVSGADEPARLVRVAWDERELGRWHMWSLAVGDAYAATLVAERPPAHAAAPPFSVTIRQLESHNRTGAPCWASSSASPASLRR
jgi:4'-phosphopantetheinyl transferase